MLLLLLVLLLGAAPANAATVGREGTELVYRSAPGEVDDVAMQTKEGEANPTRLLVYERYKPITPASGCERHAKEHLDCALDGLTAIRILAGDGQDWVQVLYPLPVIADMGPGDDLFTGGGGATVTVNAGDGRDLVNASAGTVDLGPGDDAANVGTRTPGPIHVGGGEGNDDISVLGDHKPGITVSGGPGDDHLSGDIYGAGDPVEVSCGPGNDRSARFRLEDHLGDGCAGTLTGLAPPRVSPDFQAGTLTGAAYVSVVFVRRRDRALLAQGSAVRAAGPLRLRLRTTAAGKRAKRNQRVFVTITTRTSGDRHEITFESRLS